MTRTDSDTDDSDTDLEEGLGGLAGRARDGRAEAVEALLQPARGPPHQHRPEARRRRRRPGAQLRGPGREPVQAVGVGGQAQALGGLRQAGQAREGSRLRGGRGGRVGGVG